MLTKPLLLFLGGTCGNNNWRKSFATTLCALGVPPGVIFNPVVPDWTEAAQKAEEEAKAKATHMLFYIASPKQEGNPLSAYSMVEAAMALYDNPKSVVVFDYEGIEGQYLKSMKQTERVLKARFPHEAIFGTAEEAITWLVHDMMGDQPRWTKVLPEWTPAK